MGPDETPVEPQHGTYDDDVPDIDITSLEPDYEAEESDEVEEQVEPIPDDRGGPLMNSLSHVTSKTRQSRARDPLDCHRALQFREKGRPRDLVHVGHGWGEGARLRQRLGPHDPQRGRRRLRAQLHLGQPGTAPTAPRHLGATHHLHSEAARGASQDA